MRVALMLRCLLGRWLQLASLVPFVTVVVVLSGPTVATGIAVWLMGIVGWFSGVLTNDLRHWPNRTLVPSYSKTLFQTVLVVLLLIPLACGLLWTMVGNPPPPFGPGLLWGTVMTLWVVRAGFGPVVLTASMVGIIGLGLYLIWAAKQEMHPVVFESVTDLRLQIAALVLAALALFDIKRSLNAPSPARAPDLDAATPLYSKFIGLLAGPRVGLRREVVMSSPLVVLALLLVLVARAGITTYPAWVVFACACLAYAPTRMLVRLATIHVPLRSLWLSGAVETRGSLGRKCARVILIWGLGWVPAGLVGAAILVLGGVDQTAPFDGVFLVTLTILLWVALVAGTVRRIPSPTKGWWQMMVVAMFCGGLITPLIFGVELGWAVRSALVAGLAGLGTATWYAVARALARAEIVQ